MVYHVCPPAEIDAEVNRGGVFNRKIARERSPKFFFAGIDNFGERSLC